MLESVLTPSPKCAKGNRRDESRSVDASHTIYRITVKGAGAFGGPSAVAVAYTYVVSLGGGLVSTGDDETRLTFDKPDLVRVGAT